MSFVFNLMPGFTEFSSLFDEYRINCLVLTFHPMTKAINAVNATTTTGSGQTYVANTQWTAPKLHWIYDQDDGTNPTSLNEMLEYANHKQVDFNRDIKIKLVPAVAVPVYKTGASWGYGSKKKQWLDLAFSDIPMYAIKFAVDTINANHRFIYSIDIKVYMSFRTVR